MFTAAFWHEGIAKGFPSGIGMDRAGRVFTVAFWHEGIAKGFPSGIGMDRAGREWRAMTHDGLTQAVNNLYE